MCDDERRITRQHSGFGSSQRAGGGGGERKTLLSSLYSFFFYIPGSGGLGGMAGGKLI